MKIKRYLAASMRAALAQVRAEQGPDAVILSSRRVEEGIEVIAAVDYDEALIADATQKRVVAQPSVDHRESSTPAVRTPEGTSAGQDASRAAAPATFSIARAGTEPQIARNASQTISVSQSLAAQGLKMRQTAAEVAPQRIPAAGAATELQATPAPQLAAPHRAAPHATAPAAASPASGPALAVATRPGPASPSLSIRADSGYLEMQREIKDLREMLRGELQHMSWNDKRLREPLQARVLEELTTMDIAPDIAMSLAKLAPRRTQVDNPSSIPLALLVRHLPVVDDLAPLEEGVIAVVGPTGAGKTTTIAKLAARWSMQHGSQDLALVSTDGYRIGAREQLMTYARILGAPMHVANNGKELARVLERLKSKKLVLIDTAGMGPRDVRLSEQLAALQLGAARARVLLALPAQGEGQALEEIVRSFASVSPTACIVTKVDEAASLGAVISTTLRHKLRIAYLCTGQRVPEDLHTAHTRRLWFIRLALQLKEGAAPRGNGYYARHFGGVPAHA